MVNNYRSTCISTLKKILYDKSYSNLVINNDIKNVDAKFRGLFRKSVLGVIENLMLIDYVIDYISSTKTKKMETDVLITLRLAVYQLLFLQNSSENVIVNESVQYIKDKGSIKTSKFINAVLRNIIRGKDEIMSSLDKLDFKDKMSVKYSYPKWIVDKWIKEFGQDKIEEILKINNEEALLNIRFNTIKIIKENLEFLLYNKDIEVTDCKIANRGLVVEDPFEIELLEEYEKGYFSIQSESSMLAGQVLNPNKNSLIIDLCASPGGKSFNVCEMMNNTGEVISRDIYVNKVRYMENEAKRLGLKNIKCEVYDATILDKNLVGKADYCIADVPCTGLGIIRRKPEIKYNKQESHSSSIKNLQYKILLNGSKYLKVGGEIVYSTCTVSKEENIDVVNRFLENNKNFSLVDITTETKGFFETSSNGYIEIYPHIHHMDGFFIAKLKKMNE